MAKIKIDAVTDSYLSLFPANWLDSIDTSSEDKLGSSISNAISNIDTFLSESFLVFAGSVISGEYIVKDVEKSLANLSDALCHDDSPTEEDSVRTQMSQRLRNAENIIVYAIGGYKGLISEFKGKCNVRKPKQFMSLVRRTPKDVASAKMLSLFDLLFKVSHNDLMPSYNEDVIKTLLHQHTELSSYIDDKNYPDKILQVCEVLRDKCMFLLKKILESDNTEVDFLVDYHQRHIDSTVSVAPYLNEYINRFEFYIKDKYQNEQIAEDIDQRCFKNDIAIWELPLLIKYYKDRENTTQKQIDNIVTTFEKKLLEYKAEGPFDEYALASLENYMANCRLSFKLSQGGYTPEMLVEDMDTIESIQQRTGIRNFYPFRKAILFLIGYIRKHREERNLQIYDLLDKVDKYVVKLENAIRWCKEQDFIPIQSPYKGCLVRNPSFGVVFVPSTYCRPLQYEKNFDELQRFKVESIVLRNEAVIIEDKIEIGKIQSQIDNSNKRLIDLFTLFVTIAAFIFGAIEFFASSKTEGVVNMLLNILSLGCILLLFSCSVSLLTMSKENFWKQPRFIVAAAVMVLYIAAFVTLIIIAF